MTNHRLLLTLICILFSVVSTYGQLTIDADIRPRFEYRHGFGNLFPDNGEPGVFVQQRTRLNISYGLEKLQLMVSVQDVSIWGDTPQISPIDGNDSFSLFQAWVAYQIDSKWSTKLGRQVLSYDDQRILGGLDWAMQGRSHDVALIKYKNETFKTDIGFAFNQERPSNEGNGFFLQDAFTYKTMQFAHLHKEWNNIQASFLFLNSGFQDFKIVDGQETPDGVLYRQTTGTYFKFPLKSLQISGSAYYQFGRDNNNTKLNAYQAMLEATYKPTKHLYGLGLELLSGTDQAGDSRNKSFFPLYGTNHKFNGYMDYFFVGNHANNVGLNDIFAKAVFKTSEKSSLLTKIHYFSSNAELLNNADTYLGTEIDVVFTQKLIKDVTLNIGYSHLFASESMSLIRDNRPNDNTNNWAWARLIINPTLFTNFKQ
ncbi:alginate export family protein [uncultured Dokdonia sp.]|uniref:alginate export family protein n=1 Tax=uncultured Dokdonia sp. TaxID=575653 RepID=UPI0026019F60|nr:alginate export family protein [uncultured Dokdonia sp.]